MADVRCPKCGSETVILAAKKDDLQYYVCINRPRCKGRIAVDDVRYKDSGGEKPAPKVARKKPRPRKEPPARKKAAEPAVSKRVEEKRRFRWSFKRSGHKEAVPTEVSWGDDWGGEIPASKLSHDRPRRRREQSAPEHGAEWGKDWDEEIPKAKTARVEPRPRTAPKAAHEKPQRRKEPDVVHGKPKRLRAPEKEVIPPKKKPSEPRYPKVARDKKATEEKARSKRQPRTEADEDELREKNKRNLIVMIIALIVTFLAIDGMIYAVVALR